MEEKKLDVKTIVGFVLISGLLMWMMYTNTPTPEELKEQEKKEQVEQNKVVENTQATAEVAAPTDSLSIAKAQQALGSFAYSASLPSANENVTEIKNDVLALKIANKGGYITEATVLGFEKFEKNSGELVKIINDNNANFDITLNTNDNRTLHTKDLFFEPKVSTEGENQVVTMQLKAGPNQFLEYRYVLKPGEYMLDFSIRSQGLENVVNTSKPLDLEWQLKTYRNEKSISYENRYTELVYEYEEGKDDYLNAQKELAETTAEEVTYVAFKQHHFTSILLTDTPFKTAEFKSENLVANEDVDTVYTKNFTAKLPLEFKNGAVNYTMNWYYGPAKYQILNDYNRNVDEVMPLG